MHGVRVFSLDSSDELAKIVAATTDREGSAAQDLSLCVRLRVSSEYAELSLAAKFGGSIWRDAAPLLQATRQVADSLGLCFHVGSQAMTPFAYVQALERVRGRDRPMPRSLSTSSMSAEASPSIYPGMEPPPLQDYFNSIHRAAESLPVSYSSELWCEPRPGAGGRIQLADRAGREAAWARIVHQRWGVWRAV